MNGHIEAELARMLEAMRVEIEAAIIAGPTTLASNVGIERIYRKYAPEYIRLKAIVKKQKEA